MSSNLRGEAPGREPRAHKYPTHTLAHLHPGCEVREDPSHIVGSQKRMLCFRPLHSHTLPYPEPALPSPPNNNHPKLSQSTPTSPTHLTPAQVAVARAPARAAAMARPGGDKGGEGGRSAEGRREGRGQSGESARVGQGTIWRRVRPAARPARGDGAAGRRRWRRGRAQETCETRDTRRLTPKFERRVLYS